MSHKVDAAFTGSIPKLYDQYLVPLIFQPYADDLVKRLLERAATTRTDRVLELAAGTGVVTRAMDRNLPPSINIVATDLNQAMLDEAAAIGCQRSIIWQQADAMQLPFADGQFDVVICQYGVMFFPDKPRAFAEARRVLKPDGVLLFNVWDRIEENEFALVILDTLTSMFPSNPPQFLRRTPYGYYDRAQIEADLVQGGFNKSIAFDTVTARSRAANANIPAMAFCQGTPVRNEIETRDASRLGEATELATRAIAERFGDGQVDAKIQAHVICAER